MESKNMSSQPTNEVALIQQREKALGQLQQYYVSGSTVLGIGMTVAGSALGSLLGRSSNAWKGATIGGAIAGGIAILAHAFRWQRLSNAQVMNERQTLLLLGMTEKQANERDMYILGELHSRPQKGELNYDISANHIVAVADDKFHQNRLNTDALKNKVPGRPSA